MDAMNRFISALTAKVSTEIESASEERSKDLGKAILFDAFDLDGAPDVAREPAEADYVHVALFKGTTEIFYSLESLQDIQVYIRRFPYSGTRVTKGRYLLAQVEAYLSELYVLRERIEKFLVIVGKIYKESAEKDCARLKRWVRDCMKGVTDLRDGHIHEARFRDKKFERLDMLDFFSKTPDPIGEMAKAHYEELYRDARKYWRETMRVNLEEIDKLVEAVFTKIHPHVFTEDGQLIIPASAKRAVIGSPRARSRSRKKKAARA